MLKNGASKCYHQKIDTYRLLILRIGSKSWDKFSATLSRLIRIISTIKVLIQQGFKGVGVGVRWSEIGFDHLLQLQLAWVNQRLD